MSLIAEIDLHSTYSSCTMIILYEHLIIISRTKNNSFFIHFQPTSFSTGPKEMNCYDARPDILNRKNVFCYKMFLTYSPHRSTAV